MNTSIDPAMTPDFVSGSVTFRKAVAPSAYRSRAASTNFQSMRSIDTYNGRIMKVRKL